MARSQNVGFLMILSSICCATKAGNFRLRKNKDFGIVWCENKSADQLCSCCAADMWFCFGTCRVLVFSQRRSLSYAFIENEN